MGHQDRDDFDATGDGASDGEACATVRWGATPPAGCMVHAEDEVCTAEAAHSKQTTSSIGRIPPPKKSIKNASKPTIWAIALW